MDNHNSNIIPFKTKQTLDAELHAKYLNSLPITDDEVFRRMFTFIKEQKAIAQMRSRLNLEK